MRVLLVDDEGSLLLTLAANLELEGFEVVGAESGERALAIAASEPFDLVLSDIRMPGMSGVELFQKLRALRPGIPVVLMTAFALEELVDLALSEGAFTVLPKPFSIEQVTATLLHAAKRPLVLVVDGAEAEATARALSKSGVPARSVRGEGPAPEVEDVIQAVSEGRIDVCVVPLEPERGGVETLVRRLLSLEPSPAFLAVAGKSAPDIVQRMADLRALACVRRPIDIPALARLVGRARAALRGFDPPPSMRAET